MGERLSLLCIRLNGSRDWLTPHPESEQCHAGLGFASDRCADSRRIFEVLGLVLLLLLLVAGGVAAYFGLRAGILPDQLAFAGTCGCAAIWSRLRCRRAGVAGGSANPRLRLWPA
jgi:hypothetical protein